MRQRYLLPLLFLSLLTAFSCSKKTDQEQAQTAQAESEEIDPYQNLVFSFGEPVVPADQVNRWDTTRYVQFEPAIRGKFKWANDGRELVFSPLEPFRPSTAFRASLRTAALPAGKQNLILSRPKFHTPFLSLGGAQVFFGRSRRAAGTAELQANVRFNYAVRPADLRPRLRLSQGGRPVAFSLPAAGADRTLVLTINQEVRPDQPLHFEVGAGLLAVGGSAATASPLVADAEVPSQQTLQVRELTGAVLNGQAVVNVLTNQPVSVADIQPLLKVTPAVPYEIEALESGLALRGGFEVGKTYQVSITPGARGALGGQLAERFDQAVSFGDSQPSISFANADKAMYLNALGDKNLGLRLNEVENVKVTVAKVYASNIQDLLRASKQYGYDSDEDEGADDSDMGEDGDYVDRSYQYYDLENRGDVLFTRTYATAGLAKANGLRLLNLNLKDLEFSSPLKGLYVVRVQDTERQWLRQDKLVALTDLGVIIKQGVGGSAVVFLNSLRTARPVSGATVRFISTNNQVMGTAVTNGQGVARYDSAAGSRLRLGLVTATREADFTFLTLKSSRVETSRFAVGGQTSNAAHYQAFLYGDRDLYRPGDTIHTNTVVRTDDWRPPPAGLPVKVRLLLPTGKEYASLGERLSATGAVESRFILPPSAMTGLYSLEVLTGNDVLLASRQVSVEEFIPDRLRVTVTAAPAVLRPAQTVTATVAAQNLFGPPATGRKFEVEFSLKEKIFSAPKYPDYDFTINTGERARRSNASDAEAPAAGIAQRFQKEVRQGETDAAGRGTAAYPLPDARDLGTLEGVAFATIFDETGRPVNRLATFEVQTQETMFGIGKTPELVSTRQALSVPLIALKPDGYPMFAPARVQVVRLLWETVLERQGGRYVYNSQKREQVLSNQLMAVGKHTVFDFTPTYSGEYEVRVARPGAASYVAAHFYAYGSGDTAGNSFEVNTEGEVVIEADKPKYAPGETAQLLLKTPFPGRVLVTVERDRVLDHFYVDTDQKSARVSIPIRTGHVPNVYVTATAIRPITDNALPLTVARGFVPLTVEKPATRLPVAVKAVALSRSQTFQTIEVRTAPRAQVTLAVVDEGILQRKNYQTPDPYGYFYQKRALEVSAFDIYPFLLPELGSSSSTSSSGGDAADLARRTSPVPSRRVKLVAKWSGILTADAAGIVRYKVRVPQFSGALRVMAVAYKDDAFGNAEQTMRVADPVVISTALPRFMSPGDTIDVPVTLTNTTKSTLNGRVDLFAQTAGDKHDVYKDSPLATVFLNGKSELVLSQGKNLKSVTNPFSVVKLVPNSEQRVTFRVVARQVGTVFINARIFHDEPGKKDPSVMGNNEITELPIRPAAPLSTRTGSGEVAAGKPAVLNLRTDFLPSSLRSKLVLSRSPLIQFSKDLNYLLQYPYGCLEQTVSAAFPQLYFGDLAATLQQKPGGRARAQRYNPNYHVQEAIRKTEAMQLYNGSLSYWPGGDYDNWWATAYAAHFLLEAKQAGFAVNQNTLDKVLRYLQLRLKKRETEPYQYFTADGLARQRIIAKREITYSLYVLALAGRQDAVALNYYKANRPLLTPDARFLLACTYALGGQQRAFQEVLPRQFTGERSGRELGDSFASPIRDEALALNALLEADPNNPQVNAIARQLSRQVRAAPYLNTQERAFALLALGKIARRSRASTATATLLADGKEIGKFDGKDLTVNNVANRQLTIKASGAGPLYYYWEEEGIAAGGHVREEDRYLKVRRYFATRDGKPLPQGGAFKQNDLVLVVIVLQSADAAGDVKNVAITDLLPAGLEIENPRLGAQRDTPNLANIAQPDYLDVRDDRLNLFTTATTKPKVFVYLARAVSKGTFKLGPVSADAMYNADYHSYNGAGVVRVK